MKGGGRGKNIVNSLFYVLLREMRPVLSYVGVG